MDEYAVPGEAEFTVGSLFISIARFIGIFFGSFVLGCAMGLVTALVSSHKQKFLVNKVLNSILSVCMNASWLLPLADEVLQAERFPTFRDVHVCSDVLLYLPTGRGLQAHW